MKGLREQNSVPLSTFPSVAKSPGKACKGLDGGGDRADSHRDETGSERACIPSLPSPHSHPCPSRQLPAGLENCGDGWNVSASGYVLEPGPR